MPAVESVSNSPGTPSFLTFNVMCFLFQQFTSVSELGVFAYFREMTVDISGLWFIQREVLDSRSRLDNAARLRGTIMKTHKENAPSG